jgi:hypothetical protein
MKPVAKYLILMSLLSFLGCGTPLDDSVRLQFLSYGGTNGYHAYSNIGYTAERLEDGKTRVVVQVGNDRDRVFEAEGAVMDSLEAIVRDYRMDRYKGHYEPKMDILDGDSWSLELRFSDGQSTSCGGYMAYPPRGGAEALGKVEGILSRWLYQEPAEEVGLVSFRYELFSEEGDEAFAFRKDAAGCSMDYCPMGATRNQHFEGIDAAMAQRLANIVRWSHMGSYTGENRAEEDTSRLRWLLTVEYENGQKIETMDYLDRKPDSDSWRQDVPSFSEMDLRHETERLFSEVVQSIAPADAK